MRLEMRGQMRLEQKMKLAPHMIQSMEILQLPILALQERIEQELNSNPVLEIDEPSNTEQTDETNQQISSDSQETDDFGKIDTLDDNYKEYMNQSEPYRSRSRNDDVDSKLQALKNTVAPPKSLHEYLQEQWGLVEADEKTKQAGSKIIDYIDNRGYLSVRLEQLYNKDRADFTFEDLKKALELVQTLEPTGIGASNMKECLLIQMAQSGEDMSFESRLIAEHLGELLENHLPEVAAKMRCSVEQINHAIERISKLDTSPGLQVSNDQNHPITADIIVEYSDELAEYNVALVDSSVPNLKINDYYANKAKDTGADQKTREFLQNNIRSAQWIMDAIEQRKNTLLRVAKSVVKYQKDFFDKGQLHLKPLPMSKVADDVGVHLATVSRAVAGKYIQCSRGVLPLRKFFSGGMKDDEGKSHSWEAIRAKLQQIIDAEDKAKPLSDDKICKKLAELGIGNLARRTVAKYRKLLNIPAARFRKKY